MVFGRHDLFPSATRKLVARASTIDVSTKNLPPTIDQRDRARVQTVIKVPYIAVSDVYMICVEVVCRLNADDGDVVVAGRDVLPCESTIRSRSRAVVPDFVSLALNPNSNANQRITVKASYATPYCASGKGAVYE
jgi:hypothetical protein